MCIRDRVSSNRFEKNVLRTIEVFDDLISKGLFNKQIILLGCEPKSIFEKAIINTKNFKFCGYVSQKELSDYIVNAYCMVYPSLNEGFGYPPLLAMGNSVPVIASSATSIPEATGNVPLLFSPKSKDDLASRILEMEYNEEVRNRIITDGKIWVEQLLHQQKIQTQEILNYIFSDNGN